MTREENSEHAIEREIVMQAPVYVYQISTNGNFVPNATVMSILTNAASETGVLGCETAPCQR